MLVYRNTYTRWRGTRSNSSWDICGTCGHSVTRGVEVPDVPNRHLYEQRFVCTPTKMLYICVLRTRTHTHTNADMVEREAIKNTEENGIVFIDEIDKIIDVHRSGTVFPQVLDIVTTFIICIKLNYIVTKIIMI